MAIAKREKDLNISSFLFLEMANEATLFIETAHPIDFTVADGTAITKGTILRQTDPFTASVPTADNDIIAGIAAADKIASDGVTKLAVYRQGIFKLTASGAITQGDAIGVFGDGSNKVGSLDVTGQTLSGARCLGTALETAANGDTFFAEVLVQQTWPSV